MSDLADAAEHLYGVSPEDFVAERTERAARARADGDRQLAAAVTRLPKPTTAAWLLNLLVREHPDQVSELISLGDALRTAQENLSGPQLRQLSRQRHEVIAGFTRRALAPARAAGRPVTADLTAQVQETLSAAIADPTAGEALLSGRLTKGLTYAGLGDVSVSTPARRAGPPPFARSDDRGAEREHRRRIQEAAAEVERLAEAAGTAAEEADRAHREAEEDRARSEASAARLDELRAELEQQEAALAAAQATAAESGRRADDAQRAGEALQQELAAARQRLAEVEGD